MNIASVDDLQRAARQQPEARQLLFGVAGAELPAHASAAQRAQCAAGLGVGLSPLMCVHKSADGLSGFDALRSEAAPAGPPWAIVFTTARSGRGGQPPSAAGTDAALRHMVGAVKAGRRVGMPPCSRAGEPVPLA